MRNHLGGALGFIAGLAVFGWVALGNAQEPQRIPPTERTLNPAQTAVIFVDFQNNFASPQGELYPLVEKQLRESKMLEHSLQLATQARKLGIQVIHVTEGYTDNYRELDWGNTASFHRGQILRQAWKTTDTRAALFEPMRGKTDLIFPNRIAMSGFGGNAVDSVLKARGIRYVAVAGFTTDVCVYATVLAGYDLGYRMFAISDAMVAADVSLGVQMTSSLYPRVSRVLTTAEFLAMFQGKETPALVSQK